MKNKAFVVALLAMVFAMLQVLTASAQMVSITEIMIGNLSSLSNSASVSLIGDNSSASTTFDTADSDAYHSSGFSWWTGFQSEYLPVNARLDFNSGSPGTVTFTRHVTNSILNGVFGLEKTLSQTFSKIDAIAISLDSYENNLNNSISISNVKLNDSYTILNDFIVGPGDSRLFLIELDSPITSASFDVHFDDGSLGDINSARFEIYAFNSGSVPIITSVPEPSTLALLFLTTPAVYLFFRKKGAHTP